MSRVAASSQEAEQAKGASAAAAAAAAATAAASHVLHPMPALSPPPCCAHRRAVMQQVEASATLIDDMIQEVARELFLDVAVSHVMGKPCIHLQGKEAQPLTGYHSATTVRFGFITGFMQWSSCTGLLLLHPIWPSPSLPAKQRGRRRAARPSQPATVQRRQWRLLWAPGWSRWMVPSWPRWTATSRGLATRARPRWQVGTGATWVCVTVCCCNKGAAAAVSMLEMAAVQKPWHQLVYGPHPACRAAADGP